MTQEAIRLRHFLFLIMDEAMRWLAELLSDSITSWEELQVALFERFFPTSKIVKLRRSIENFKHIEGEPLHEI